MKREEYPCQPSLQFLDLRNKCIKEDIWEELDNGLWKYFDVDAYLSNDMLKPSMKHFQKNLFPCYHQIEPGFYYDSESGDFKLDLYNPQFADCSFDKILNVTSNFFDSLNVKKIGVHLSGGLDSSIIIALLHTLDIPFTPIGLCSEAFEFRTERHIQEKLISWGNDGELIPIEEYPYFSKLLDMPMHQIPCGICKSYASSVALTKAFKEKGCDIVISGQGGDSLFVESVRNFNDLNFNIGNEFDNDDFNDLVYSPNGVKLMSFFSFKPVIDLISSARTTQPFDPLKIWARNWFKDILIPELTDFTYCADFLGLNLEGLHIAKKDIKVLFEESFELTQNPHFSPSSSKKFLNQDVFSFGFKQYMQYCSLLSIMVWIHSIANKNQPYTK